MPTTFEEFITRDSSDPKWALTMIKSFSHFYEDKSNPVLSEVLADSKLPPPPAEWVAKYNADKAKKEKNQKQLLVKAQERKELKLKIAGNKIIETAVTLTTIHKDVKNLDEDLDKILRSYSFKVFKYHIKRELTKEGRPHYHLRLFSTESIYKSYVLKLKLNTHPSCLQVKTLKGPNDKKRWQDYLNKKEKDMDAESNKYFDNIGYAIYEEIINDQ